jgi:hypothetical protein
MSEQEEITQPQVEADKAPKSGLAKPTKVVITAAKKVVAAGKEQPAEKAAKTDAPN